MKDALAILVSQAKEAKGLSFRKADKICDLNEGTIASIVYGNSKRPDEEVLKAIERGLGIPYPKLALAAYGIINDSDVKLETGNDTSPLGNGSPADVNDAGAWSRTGRKRQRAIVST